MNFTNPNQNEKHTQPKGSALAMTVMKILSKLKQFYFPFLTENNSDTQRVSGTRQMNHFRTLRSQESNDISVDNPSQADLNQLLDTDLTTITADNEFSFSPFSVKFSLEASDFHANRRCSDEEFAEMDLGCEAIKQITPLNARMFMLIQSLIFTAGLTAIAFVIANAILVDTLGMSHAVVITSLAVAGLIMWLTKKVFLPKVAYDFIIDYLPIYKGMKKDAILLNLAKHKLYVFFTTYDLKAFSHLMERNENKELKYYFDDLSKSQNESNIDHIFLASTSTQMALDVLDSLQQQARLSIEKRKNMRIVK